jgi:GTP pyrophosphokinase
MGDVKEIIVRHLSGEETPTPPAPPKTTPSAKAQAINDIEELVLGENILGLEWHTARCCNPIFGDEVFGFTTINKGVTIHRTDCPNARRLKELYPYRVIAARWKGEQSKGRFIASIRVVAEDRGGLLNQITETIGSLGITIRSIALSPMRDNLLGGVVNVEVGSSQIADMVTHNIQRIEGVKRVYRVNK